MVIVYVIVFQIGLISLPRSKFMVLLSSLMCSASLNFLMPVLFFGENLSFFPLDGMACSIGMNSNAFVLVIISDCPLVFFQSGFKSPARFAHIRAATLALHPIYHTFDFFYLFSQLTLPYHPFSFFHPA